MRIKKGLVSLIAILSGMTSVVAASDTYGVNLQKRDGTVLSVPFAKMRSISFAGNDAIIVDTDGQQNIPFDAMSHLTFDPRTESSVPEIIDEIDAVSVFLSADKNVVASSTSGVLSVTIVAMGGNVVLREVSSAKTLEMTIPVSSLPKGVYVVVVSTEAGVSTEKIILN